MSVESSQNWWSTASWSTLDCQTSVRTDLLEAEVCRQIWSDTRAQLGPEVPAVALEALEGRGHHGQGEESYQQQPPPDRQAWMEIWQ